MSSSVLESPSFKIRLEQLLHAHKSENSEQHCNKWVVPISLDKMSNSDCPSANKSVTLSNVWIQGIVLLQTDQDMIYVSDDTGVALVAGLSKIPKSSNNLQRGDHVMAVGHVLNVGPAFHLSYEQTSQLDTTLPVCAKLKAIKVTNISQNLNCRTGDWWKYEVAEAQSHIIDYLNIP